MSAEGQREDARRPLVLLAGNPNAGKTTLFNAITGARAKVANYPGVTVERRSAALELPGVGVVDVIDLPGAYSLTSRSAEERIAVEAVIGLEQATPDALLVVCDATALRRGLYLVTQLVDTQTPTVVALTMTDEARKLGVEIDHAKLEAAFGVRFVSVVAAKGEGLDDLLAALAAVLRDERSPVPVTTFDPPVEDAITHVAKALAEHHPDASDAARRTWAQWALLSTGDEHDLGFSGVAAKAVTEARAAAEAEGLDLDLALVSRRYQRVDETTAEAVKAPARTVTTTDRVDAVLTHRVWGLVVFVLVMAVVFDALFAWSEPVIAVIEDLVAYGQSAAEAALPAGPIAGLVSDGIIAGVGNVVVFVPQIALLFLFISFLEDSGYLARVAFVIDRIMGGVGLHGRAFVPMLSGFACAVPAVMATRTLESRRDRLLTMLAIPFTSCSARLPIYVLVIAVVFPANQRVLGVLSLGGAVLLAMYLLSVGAALTAAAVLRRTVLRGPRPTLLLELPPYRMPLVRNVLRQTWQRVKRFLVDAGTIILAFTIVLWALLSFPKDDSITARYDGLRAAVSYQVPEGDRPARLSELDGQEAGEQLRQSAAGRLGRAMEPALEPLGMDWRIGIGIIGAFAAREVFVSTLGIVFGIGDADEETAPLRSALRDATWPDGRPVLTPLSGVALMVFFVLACQCMSTVAVVRRESGGWKWPLFMVTTMTAIAYTAALLVFQLGSLLGLGGAS